MVGVTLVVNLVVWVCLWVLTLVFGKIIWFRIKKILWDLSQRIIDQENY